MINVDDIIRWEGGEMEVEEVLPFFASLIKSGAAWSLQGMYGRQAQAFINGGYIDRMGNVTDAGTDLINHIESER